MKPITSSFLKLLFNEGEEICFSANKYAYPSEPQENINEETVTLVAINPIKGQRNDENVTAFRTFLIECDDMSLADQKQYVDSTGFPYSICVYSGSKSLHFGLVLDQDLPSIKMYRFIAEWILNIVKKSDQKLKNPSRSIRFPGGFRTETQKMQALLYLGERISLETLTNWLEKHEDMRPMVVEARPQSGIPNMGGIKPWAFVALQEGIHNKPGRNQRWMSIACEMAINGFELEDTISKLESFFVEQSDFKRREWETAIKSGWAYAAKIRASE